MPGSSFFSRSRYLLLCLADVFIACAGHRTQLTPRQMVSIAIVADASISSDITNSHTIAGVRCSEVVAAIAPVLSVKGLRQLDVLVLATGGKETSYEGRVILPWRSFTPTARLFGKNKNPAEQRQAFLREIDGACRSALKSEKTSPIFYAIERAATSLEQHAEELSRAGDLSLSRSLIVLSDLRENVHQGIKQRLLTVSSAVRKGSPVPKPSSAVPVLKLEGVTVRVCGLSEHAGGSADDLAVSPEAVTLTWRGILPAASFDASCRRDASLGTAAAVGGAR